MRPTLLKATNLRTFPSVDWKIPDGICCLTGANGSGKSTLLNAIELALFADGSRDLAPALGPFAEKLEITLEFEHDGDHLRVRRGYGKSKATLDFEQEVDERWFPLSMETVRETQALVEETLGLNRSTFNASAFLAQGDSANFPESSPADRKAVLGAILDPHESWPKRANRALAERKIAETELQIAQGKIETLSGLADDLPAWLQTVEKLAEKRADEETSYATAEKAYEDAQAALAENAAAAERRRAAELAVETARREAGRAQQALADARHAANQAVEARTRLATLRETAGRIPELEKEAQAQRDALEAQRTATMEKRAAEENAERLAARARELAANHQRLTETLDALHLRREKLRGADDGTERCDHCQQILGAEAKREAIGALARQILLGQDEADEREIELAVAEEDAASAKDSAEAMAIPVMPPLFDVAERLTAARSAENQAHALEATLATLAETASRTLDLERDAGEAETAYQHTLLALRDLPGMDVRAALENALEAAKRARANRRVDLDEAAAALVRAQTALERARDASTELEKLRDESRKETEHLNTLRLAERAFGRDGIPALIAENTVGVIEAETNRVLEQLPTASGTVFRVELRTQKALKSSDALRETLDILVSDRATTREFATFSGGERFRVSFALRWALAKLLANRRGAESRLLVIDEPDGLDAGGMDGLAEVLRANSETFFSVLLVSHNPLLASAFEQVVEIESDGDVSRIAGSTVGSPGKDTPNV